MQRDEPEQVNRATDASAEPKASETPVETAAASGQPAGSAGPGAEERHRLLVEWNQTDRDYPRDRSIHQLFEAQASRSPETVAVLSDEGALTYGELNVRADRLARALRQHGVTRGTFVALCLDRSPGMLIALLAILKAGGAYVPLDPAYPDTRLQFLLQDSAPALLLTLEKWRTKFASSQVPALCVDQDAKAIPDGEPLPSKPDGSPEDPAYLLYTSGSTGHPKGVLVPHRGVVRLVSNPNYVTLGKEETILQFAPLSFDASTFEIWGALLNGGRVALMPPGQPSPGELGEAIQRYGVTTMWLTAGLFHLMVDERMEALKPLRQLLAGGDVLSPEHVLRAYRALPGCRIINGYGPTENTTFTCCHTIAGEQDVVPAVPIGRPISNTRVYVLDERQQPVAVGVAGELYTGGDGVALGYLNDPGLTAERFIPDPFRPAKSARLYRTGDSVRWRPDGVLEFLGRLDRQIKIRGFRVEAGEIESVLRAHPAMADCAVVTRPAGGTDKSLIAFVVARPSVAWSNLSLRSWLGERLPSHMVPARFVGVEVLPLTPNGKLDRRALESRDVGSVDAHTEPVPPSTALEHQLAELWRKILQQPNLGVRDSFFALGGDSLLAMRLVVELERLKGCRLPLAAFFEAPTIESLARRLEKDSAGQVAPRLEAQAPGEPLLMSYEQQAFWLRSHLDQDTTVHNVHHAVWLRGSLDVPALRSALVRLLDRQSGLRLCFPARDDRNEAAYWPAADLLQTVNLGDLPPAERPDRLIRHLETQAAKPFDLQEERLLRLELIRLDERTHVLSLNFHHILGDAWSLAIWEQEWQALYAATRQQRPAGLPPLPIRYTDYAAWQRRHQTGDRLMRLQDFWTGQLRDAPQLAGLPTDHPRPARPQGRGARCRLELPAKLHRDLMEVAQGHDGTVFMVLFGAFNTLLYRYSGRTDLCVGVPVANRRLAETQNLIGLFLSIVALRTRLDGETSFAGLLRQIRHNTLAAQDHADLPFAHVLRALGTAPRQDHNPCFQILFNWVTPPEMAGHFGKGFDPDLQVEPFRGTSEMEENAISNLDMVVTLAASEDGGIAINWSYDTALFEPGTVRFLADSYRCLLEQMVANPETALRKFSLADTGSGLHPLSLKQRDVWVDQMFHAEAPMYNIGGRVHLPGPLDVDRFRQAVQLLAQRHDNLRLRLTRSRDEDGVPQQTVVPADAVPVPLHDFSAAPAPKEAAREWMQRRFIEPFELEGQPLFRYDLVRVAEGDHYWLMQYHHLIADGWSLALLSRSLAEIYTSLLQGWPVGLQQPSYLDHVTEDRHYLDSDAYQEDRAYWRGQFPAAPGPLLSPRTTEPSPGSSDCHSIHLPRELFARLGLMAGRHEASTFHVFIGALAVYFARTQGCDEVVIGLPMLNRSKAVFKHTAGMFASVCPVRFPVRDGATFGELIREISRTLRTTYRHQRFPTGEINRVVKPNPGQRQMYDVGLSFESQDYNAQFDGISSRMEHLLHGFEQTPLMIYVRDIHAQEDVRLDFVTNRAFFTADEARSLQWFLSRLLDTVSTQSDSPIRLLPLITEAERHRIVREWNQTGVDFGGPQTVPSLFEDQAARSPGAAALLSREGRLTYAELNARANQLAHRLVTLGVGPEVLVAVVIERSFEIVVSLLAILKAGGVYVPIDATNPAERIRQLLADSAAPILLTQSHLLPVLTSLRGLRDVIAVDQGGLTATGQAPGNPVSRVTPDNLAYAIYTPGPAGHPQAAAISHRSFVNLLQSVRPLLKLGEGTRLLGVASPAFDMHVAEVLLPLCTGGTAVVGGTQMAGDLPLLTRWIGESQPHFIQATPATWASLLEFGWPGCHSAELISTGEILPAAVAGQLLRRGRRLWDFYGTTETTVWSLGRQVVPDRLSGSVGRPLANTSVHVLDQHGQPLPIGIPGELHIGGVGLARGYLNRPELTAAKFAADPFATVPGARLYRTGDRCRWTEDGTIQFLGRLDRQIKLRGFRIEPAEIEVALNRHPSVAQSAVLLREDQPGDRRLVGYVVLAPEATWNVSELARHLGARLPTYMVPAVLIRVDRLPVLPNGKPDRRALPAPDDSRPDVDKAYVAPRTPLETQLATLWCELLGVNRVGINDNFFDLGGHSLLAMRLSTTVERLFGRKLPVAVLFQVPTVQLLAAWISGNEVVAPTGSLVPLQPAGEKPPFFLIHGWGGDVYCYLSIAQEMAPDQPVFGVQALGLGNKIRPHTTVEQMAAHYVREIRSVQPEGPYHLGGHSLGGVFAFEVARQLRRSGQPVAVLALFDTVPTAVIPWGFYALQLLPAIPRRCLFHVRNLWRMSNRKRLDYVFGRFAFAREWLHRNQPRATAVDPQQPDGAPIPVPAQGYDDYYYTVSLGYRLRPYPGSVDVFLGPDADPFWKWYWRYMARRGARFHHVPGAHDTMITPGHVSATAQVLRSLLDRAQERERVRLNRNRRTPAGQGG